MDVHPQDLSLGPTAYNPIVTDSVVLLMASVHSLKSYNNNTENTQALAKQMKNKQTKSQDDPDSHSYRNVFLPNLRATRSRSKLNISDSFFQSYNRSCLTKGILQLFTSPISWIPLIKTDKCQTALGKYFPYLSASYLWHKANLELGLSFQKHEKWKKMSPL